MIAFGVVRTLVNMLVFALVASFGIASGARALELQTALRRNSPSPAECARDFGPQVLEMRRENRAVTTKVASECCHGVRGGAGAVIAEGKFGYMFGQASGRAHNIARAAENAAQLGKVGVRNTAEGRALIQAHFDKVVADPSNVLRTFANDHGSFVVRESLFGGPGGFIKLESTWQVLEGGVNRLTTVIPFGGI